MGSTINSASLGSTAWGWRNFRAMEARSEFLKSGIRKLCGITVSIVYYVSSAGEEALRKSYET